MNRNYEQAVEYIEKLGDARNGSIFLSFSRTEDNRRKVMKANKSPLITHIARVTIRRLPGDPNDGMGGIMHLTFQGIDEDPGKAIDKAMYEMIAWLPAAPVKVDHTQGNLLDDDGSDLV